MRTNQLALATVLAAAALSVNAGPRMESATSPFTYEAVGATPVVTIGRASAAPKAVEAPKPATAATPAKAPAATRAAVPATSTFTYDALGATPHIDVRKQPARSEVQAPASAH
ncbi:MAG TPA: hypothetical protein VFN38_12395 [Gemmatimonadaceae bacterium]|nr:hypothetical protein [Gemmatimonadaceae bacterium]